MYHREGEKRLTAVSLSISAMMGRYWLGSAVSQAPSLPSTILDSQGRPQFLIFENSAANRMSRDKIDPMNGIHINVILVLTRNTYHLTASTPFPTPTRNLPSALSHPIDTHSCVHHRYIHNDTRTHILFTSSLD